VEPGIGAQYVFGLAYWAQAKHVSVATVRRMVKAGEVRAVRIRGQLRIYAADWAAYEAAHLAKA
jgi:excisionase family DNA binding protein